MIGMCEIKVKKCDLWNANTKKQKSVQLISTFPRHIGMNRSLMNQPIDLSILDCRLLGYIHFYVARHHFHPTLMEALK
jgi:hypothetical protein